MDSNLLRPWFCRTTAIPYVMAAFLAIGASAAVPSAADRPVLAVLDPVDLASDGTQPPYGDSIRAGLRNAGRFRMIPRSEMDRRLGEFAWSPARPCHEFQCSFDAGNILLAEFVWFGTVTRLEGLLAYTFNVLHIPTGQVVHSEAGEVKRKQGDGGDGPFLARLSDYMSSLDPARFDLGRKSSRGLMAVVEPEGESLEARVIAERMRTHVYASRHYDLMSRAELQELAAAMDIRIDVGITESALIVLGARLDVAFLVHARLNRTKEERRLELSIYDVAAKRRLRDWNSGPRSGYKEILELESRFFTTLRGPAEDLQDRGKAGKQANAGGSYWPRGAISALGAAAAAGFIGLAYSLHQDANASKLRAESAYSLEGAQRWKRATRENDRNTWLAGAFAGISLAAAVTVWNF